MHIGYQQLTIKDETQGASIAAIVLYPTETPASPAIFGPYTLDVSIDAPIQSGRYPLVVISHGNGGTHIIYRTIGLHLARHGYVVAMIEHPGNNRIDNSLEGTYENLVNRPRHVRLTIDTLMTHSAFASALLPDQVAIIGHSLGGYTALALAGGKPRYKDGREIEVMADSRICALVLLAPATPWYQDEGRLSEVEVPILMLTAEHDPYTPEWHAEVVLNGVPHRDLVTHRMVENAGHFSFLSPYPPKLRSMGFLPTTDPEGFDRAAFHRVLPQEIGEFLDSALTAGRHPRHW
jgi:predicted dienelactone hydrolase